jgi:hypothetical protein
MNRFEPVVLEWAGVLYTIPANKVLGAIARIEEVVTLHELIQAAQDGKIPMAKLSMAFASVLRYAGATMTTDEEVYGAIFSPGAVDNVIAATNVLLQMMIPPNLKTTLPAGVTPKGNSKAGARQSRRRSRRA